MADHIESYSAEQLRALAAKREREESRPAMFEGVREVDVMGMPVTVDLDRMNNWNLLKMARDADDGDPYQVEEVLAVALGRETADAVMAHLAEVNREAHGGSEDYDFPRVTDVTEAFRIIFDATADPSKNR